MYLGDFKEDGDLFHKFSTRAFATGIPTTLAGSPVLSVYKDEGGAGTEKTTAETYFDLDVDHDSIAGFHNVRMDLSGDAFFATGVDYAVVITVGTVDSVNVFGETLFTFSIENRSMGQPAGATLAADIAAIKAQTAEIETDTGEIGTAGAGLSNINLPNQTMDIIGDITGDLSGSVGSVSGSVGSNVELGPSEVQTAVAAELVAIDLDHLLKTAASIPSITAGTFLDQMFDDGTAVFDRTTDSLQAIRDNQKGTDNAALASVLGALDDTAAAGDPTTGDTIMDYIKQLVNLLIGSAGAGAMPAAQDPANGINLFEMVRRIFDDTDAIEPITTALTSAAATKLALTMGASPTFTVHNAVAPTTTEFEADDITEATADHFIGRIMLFTSGILDEQATDITDYALNGGIGHFTVTALTEAPGNDDKGIII